MSHSITFAFNLDFAASSVSVPFIAPEHRLRTVEEGTSLSANRPTVRSSDMPASGLGPSCIEDAPIVHSSISPTSDPSVPTMPQKASTAPGVRSLRTAPCRPPNAFVLFRRHYLEVLRAQEAADQARHDAEQVLSDSPPTPSDIDPTLINGIDHASASNRRCSDQQVANAWRAMSEAEREPFLQEAREAKARFDRELPAFVWNTTRAAEGARRGPVAGKYFVTRWYEFFTWEECQAGSERGNI
ncbi:hypothetical protein K525DRAFT_207852 [Schizophyllum commune Loenen D]|nr:hypothetical protein K525DRAFT_207852 [Schizophyllum commune Loenen D]